ncbi:MFS transporter [Arthrobacter sp. G119Y2]|uniref:MFS transporter n=1 Tax=Arthrobacter sp. G119Y2 TaxID=3134965 RepID=UPI00311955DC
MKSTAVFYLTSYSLSLLGNSIAAIALPLILLQATGSIMSAGILAASTAVPAFLAGLLTGVVIDRVNRRTASAAADAVSAVSLAALPVVDALTGLDLGWFIVFGILGAVGDMPGLTAREALLPAIARAAGLSAGKLLGIRESIGALVMVIGPAAAGGLMVLFEGSTVLWITAGTSLAAAAVTLLIPGSACALKPEPESLTKNRPAWNQLRQGWSVLFQRDKTLRAATLMTLMMVGVLVALQGIILPAHFFLLNRPGELGLVLAALAAGTLAGGTLYAVLASRPGLRRYWLTAGLAGTAAGLAILGTLPASWAMLTGALILGLASALLGCVTGTVMVERIPEQMLGRIMGTQNSLALLAAPAGMAAAALIAERHGLVAAGLTVAGLWTAAAGWALGSPSLRLTPQVPLEASASTPGTPAAPGTMDPERTVGDEKQ